jgi:hypothetical protein
LPFGKEVARLDCHFKVFLRPNVFFIGNQVVFYKRCILLIVSLLPFNLVFQRQQFFFYRNSFLLHRYLSISQEIFLFGKLGFAVENIKIQVGIRKAQYYIAFFYHGAFFHKYFFNAASFLRIKEYCAYWLYRCGYCNVIIELALNYRFNN